MRYILDEHGTQRPETRIYESPEQIERRLQGEREHGRNIAVRFNRNNFKLEYYNTETGEIVSTHY